METYSINCPVEMTVNLIDNQWKVLIVAYLLLGNKRFNELENCIENIKQSVLIKNLKELEKNGLIKRMVYQYVPPIVIYSLTDLGFSLKPIVDSMEIWGRNYGNVS